MRPLFVDWLVRHGWPAWFAPDYATMVGIATLIGAALALRQAERDGARVEIQARAMIVAYLAALLGGYLFEWIRAIPMAVTQRSIAPIAFAGRAAYGGLIFGALAPALYLRRRGEAFLDFLDRATLGMGIVFACVRFGCFLEGCDFGRPTASIIGVRFPSGSLAAEAHALAGWVPAGSASLPVHPTQLYESCVGLLATLLARVPLGKGRRDGAAFATWLVTYASGRFLLELLRGDIERGRYASFSTAQWVSIAILAGVLGATVARRRLRRTGVVVVIGVLVVISVPSPARAEDALPPLPPAASAPPTPQAAPGTAVRSSSPNEARTEDTAAKKVATIRVALVSSLTLARPDVPSGWAAELDALYRIRLGHASRLDVGLEGRRYENAEAIHTSVGIAAEIVVEAGKHFELLFSLVPHHTWFEFKSDFFSNTNAYGLRYALGAQFPVGPIVLGVTPIAFTTTSATTVGVISQWEPRLWAGVAF